MIKISPQERLLNVCDSTLNSHFDKDEETHV
jgi:hypothetical protein